MEDLRMGYLVAIPYGVYLTVAALLAGIWLLCYSINRYFDFDGRCERKRRLTKLTKDQLCDAILRAIESDEWASVDKRGVSEGLASRLRADELHVVYKPNGNVRFYAYTRYDDHVGHTGPSYRIMCATTSTEETSVAYALTEHEYTNITKTISHTAMRRELLRKERQVAEAEREIARAVAALLG